MSAPHLIPRLSRRSLLAATGGLASAGILSACSGANTSGGGGATSSSSTVLLSTQFSPVEEKQRFEKILSTFVTDPKTSFNSMAVADFTTQVKSQVDAKKVQFGIAAALHGELTPLADYLEDVDSLVPDAAAAGIGKDLLALGKLGGSTQKYIPWMQASFVVAVNKKALQWLPSGADVHALTYDQYLSWAQAAAKASGKPVFGFPAGPKGLYHRWFQGYLLPSFTGGVITTFTSSEAATAWRWMKDFWAVCNPASTNYDNLQEPMARGEVLVGWDHVARLVQAPKDKPDDWLMVPAPIGPKGLGYMLVVAGMGIPKGGDVATAAKAIRALLQPKVQIEVLRQNAFFPVVKADLPSDLSAPVKMEAEAVAKQTASPKALVALPPVGLGTKDGELAQVFKDCFREICLKNGDPKTVLGKYASTVASILDATKVPCWAPDPAMSQCRVG